jgi:hypothetical protein
LPSRHRIDVGAGIEQGARHVDVAFARGKHQRREPAAGKLFRLAVGPVAHRRAPFEAAAIRGGDVVGSAC